MRECGMYPWQCTNSGKCSLCNVTVNEYARGIMRVVRRLRNRAGEFQKDANNGHEGGTMLYTPQGMSDHLRALAEVYAKEAIEAQEKFPGGRFVEMEGTIKAQQARIDVLTEALQDAISRLPDTLGRERLQTVLIGKTEKTTEAPKRDPEVLRQAGNRSFATRALINHITGRVRCDRKK